MIKILDRYITFQFIKSFVFSLIGLIGVLLFINLLDAMKIETDQKKILLYLSLLYSIPQITVYVLPAAIMFSVSFTISYMTNEKEFVAIFSSGISFYRAILGILIISIFLSLILLYVQDQVVVPFNKKSQNYLNQYKLNIKKMKAPKDVIFQMNLKGKDSYYFIQYFDPPTKKILGGFHVFQFKKENQMEMPEKLIEAEEAEYLELKNTWNLKKVREILFDDDFNIVKVNFYLEKEYIFFENLSFFINPNKNPSELSLKELKEEIDFRKKYSLDSVVYEVQYHAIISFPFICVIITIIGAITGNMGSIRTGNPFIKSILFSTLVIFFYQIILRLGLSLGEGGIIPPWLSGWGPLCIFFLLCLFLIYKHRR